MSASREKKQRRDSNAPVVSSRAQEEMMKAAKRKRNTIIYAVIGVVAVILVAALLIWDSGVFQRNAEVAVINGEKVTAPEVAFYYYNNDILLNAQAYAQAGMTFPYYSLSTSPKEQVITESTAADLGLEEEYVGKSFHEYFMDCALDELRQERALCGEAEAAGYVLSDEGKAAVEEAIANVDAGREQYMTTYGANFSRNTYLQQLYGEWMTESVYRDCVERAELAAEYYDAAFDSMADYSEEELRAYYQAHTDELDSVKFYWRSFEGTVETAQSEDGETAEPTAEEEEAALAKAKEEADAALAEVQGNLDAVRDNEDYTEQRGVLTNMSSFYYDWLLDNARQPGDATVFEGTNSYYVVVFEERYLEERPAVDVRHILISAMPEDDPETADVDESEAEPSEEDFAAAEEEARALLEQWKNGLANEDSFAALAEEHSADPGSNTNGGLYEAVTDGRMIANFNDWIFAEGRKSGDVTEDPILNTSSATQGYHLIYYVGENEVAWKASAREGKWLEDLEASVTIERTDKLDSYFN